MGNSAYMLHVSTFWRLLSSFLDPIIIKIYIAMKKANDLLQALQDNQLFSHPNPSLFAHLNIYADLFFSKSTRIPHPLPRCPRARSIKKAGQSSTRLQVLSWFRHLTPPQKRNAIAIRNPSFLAAFCKCLSARTPNSHFNLQTGKAIEMLTPTSDQYFEELLGGLKVVLCSEPVLYISEDILGREGLLEWVDDIASGKLFEYNCDGEDNLLWFSPKSFRPLSHALCSQIQKQILRSFLRKANQFNQVNDLMEFLKKNNKNAIAEALDMPLSEYMERPEKEMNKLLDKIRIEEDKLNAINAERLFLQMQSETKIRKGRRRAKKRKDNSSTNLPAQISSQLLKETLVDDHSNIADESPSKSLSQEQDAQSSQIFSSEDKKSSEIDALQLTSTSPQRVLSEQKEEQFAKECHSDHQPSTNQNQRSISKSESTSHLDQTFHHEDIPQNHLHISDEIKQEKIRRRKKRRVKKQQSALQELRTEIRHKFMTRQLENISQFINASTNKMLEARVMAFERVRILIQNNYPFSNAVLFGSNAIGLALPSSDVDILVVGFNCINRIDCGELLNHIGYAISCMEWAVSCELYANAKVPVLKLEIDTSIPFMQLKGSNIVQSNHVYQLQSQRQMIVKVDITINVEGLSSGGYESTLLMKKWLQKFPFAQKIVILFKHLLSFKHLNQNYRGGIGSYCLFVMVIAYIQENPKCIENQLSRTFIELLQWYSQSFNNQKEIVWLREDGPSFVSEETYQQQIDDGEERRGLLRLVDPTTSRIMSGSCSEYVKIKEFFREILEKFVHIQGMIEQQLKNTSDNHTQLSRMFQNRRQSQKWFKNAEEKHSWALMNLMGVNL